MRNCQVAMDDGADCVGCCFDCDKKDSCADVCECNYETCGNVVEIESGLTILKTNLVAIRKLNETVRQIKKLEEAEKALRQQIQEAMEKYNLDKFSYQGVSYTYKKATTKTAVDTKKLKSLYPAIAQECMNTSPVSASVMIKVE